MKFLMIGKKIFRIKRGAYNIAKRFAEAFSENFEFLDDQDLKYQDEYLIRKSDNQNLNDHFEKIIFTYQIPEQYHCIHSLNFVLAKKPTNIMFYSSTLS